MRRQIHSKPASRKPRRALLSAFYPLAIALGMVASLPAAAEDYRARTVDGWMVTVGEDGTGCFLTRQYDGAGATTLLLGLDIDGTNHLSVLNDNWSITPQQRLKLNFRLSTGGYLQQPAIGLASNGKKGFVTTFERKFPDYFGVSKALDISKGSVPVEQLNLAGSGAAVAELGRCVAAQRVRGGPTAVQGKPSSRIPTDPFAPSPTKRAKR